jgi:putative membrane protein
MRRSTAKTLIPLTALTLLAGMTTFPASSAIAQGSAKLDDPTIVAIFDAANTYDMETGSLKVTPTPPRDFALAKAHMEAMRSLRKVRGRAFDRAFLQHEVDYHNAVIDAITTTLLPAIQNSQVKDLVTKVGPAFVAHRDAAQNLLDAQK